MRNELLLQKGSKKMESQNRREAAQALIGQKVRSFDFNGRPYLMEKKRPLLEILDEIESRISPEIRELEVRDGEIVRKKNPQILRRNKDRSFWVDEEMTYHEDDKDDDEPDWEEVLDEE
jgi:hypothetical protein